MHKHFMYNINKKNWKLFSGFLFTIVLLYLFQSPYLVKRNQDVVLSDTDLDSNTTEKYAFVTFLCDDVMAEASQVLVYSLKQTNTEHDVVVLVLDDVTPKTKDRLQHLGAKIINVDQIKYPWDSTSARRKGFNKACRYSKLNLWNLTQYKKVVFLDADTMVTQPINELFDYPEFSAAVDIGGVLNTGVFVAEPNKGTYKDIMNTYSDAPSYNKGDQGFLNYYFNQTAHYLPGNYNLMVKFTHFSTLAAGFVSKNDVKVLHFTSETKPWNFHFLHQREWRENYDGHLFGLWTKALRRMRLELAEADLWDLPEWHNQKRTAFICDKQLKSNYGRRYPKTNQFTVILDLSPSTSVSSLKRLLQTYASFSRVHQIFIHGNTSIQNEDGNRLTLTSFLRKLRLGKHVKVVQHGHFKSVNNKFNPIQGITTDAVFLANENTSTSLEELEFGFQVWQKNMDSLVGYQPYSHKTIGKKNYQFFSSSYAGSYSMVSSNAMFMKSDFLHAYSCLLSEQVHHFVDQHPECADIAINMLVSGMTGVAPVLVDGFSLPNTNAPLLGSQCIEGLVRFFNGQNTLVFNNQIIKGIV